MALLQETLFGTVDKVSIAIARLREFEPEEGYYLAFSGGKDSCVILDLAKRAGVKYDAHYNLTTVDPPELVRFIRQHHPDVEEHRPVKTMWQLIVENGMPPSRIMRYCCRVLKEGEGAGRIVVTGIRWQESARRRRRGMVESCSQGASKTYLHPIIDWSTADVWEYLHANNVPYCSLYDEGFARLGCVLCPMSREVKRDMERWPRIADAYKRAILRAYNRRIARGDKLTWPSGEALFEWWINRDASDERADDAQTVMFE